MTPAQFELDLRTVYHVAITIPLNQLFLDQLVSVFVKMFSMGFKPKKMPNKSYALALETCVEALKGFSENISPYCLEQPAMQSLFFHTYAQATALLHPDPVRG